MTDGSRKLDNVKVCLCGDPSVGKTSIKETLTKVRRMDIKRSIEMVETSA